MTFDLVFLPNFNATISHSLELSVPLCTCTVLHAFLRTLVYVTGDRVVTFCHMYRRDLTALYV